MLKNNKFNGLEGLVFGMKLPYSEIEKKTLT